MVAEAFTGVEAFMGVDGTEEDGEAVAGVAPVSAWDWV
jgi:hypothetical protein